jgi:hypothetical protein
MNDRFLTIYQRAHVKNGQLTNYIDMDLFVRLIVEECQMELQVTGHDDAADALNTITQMERHE